MILEKIPPNPEYAEVLPCPCCSSEEAYRLDEVPEWLSKTDGAPYEENGLWAVQCSCGMGTGLQWATREAAVNSWNRRGGSFLNNDGLPRFVSELTPVCDRQRHLICVPYSAENLHLMAETLDIKRCWFHQDHYDIPKRRIEEITKRCRLVSPRDIVRILREAGAR